MSYSIASEHIEIFLKIIQGQFLLLTLADTCELQLLHFGLFLGIYLAALLGNGLIITAIACDHHLHTPMYFFLLNLSLIDLGSISTIVPKAMANSLWDTTTISYSGCATQVFFFIVFVTAEFYLLTIMAYDRYIAICKPLHYRTIGNLLDQFFCELPQILKLSCSDAYLREAGLLAVSAILGFVCFVFLVLSYVPIFRSVLRIPSQQGRHKAFSTCLPHLAVVSLFISTAIFAYLKPPSISSPFLNLLLAVLYSVVPPAVNPLIYSMQNKELKCAVKRQIWRMFSSTYKDPFTVQ
nr:olfactory receptor 14C36-like [Anas platyrhynchos]